MKKRFEATLTARDAKRHIAHTFTMSKGCHTLIIDLRFAPALVQGTHNMVTLTLFDPHGFRGAGHRGGARHGARIEPDAATPGYLPGALPAGEWVVQLDTHRIMPAEPLHYELDVIALSPGEEAGTPPLSLLTSATPEATAVIADAGLPDATDVPSMSAVPKPVAAKTPLEATSPHAGPRWYRGDFHAHTYHSDAADFSVRDLIAAARGFDLDFAFLTDHNTISGLAEMDAASSAELLTAGGVELTTFWGHALVLGTRDWVDWRFAPGTGRMAGVAAQAEEADHVFVIAHPEADGDPGCTGCAWRFGDMMPGPAGHPARVIEVWNGPWLCDSNNERTLALFYDWLNQGHRLVASSGTDAHGPAPAGVRPGFSVVYATALTQRAVLDALLAGHLYLSSGPQLTVTATDGAGQRRMMGDTLDRPATFEVRWADCPPGAYLRVVANGCRFRRCQAEGAGATTWTMTPAEANWLTVEIRSADGEMLALTNPIFLEA